jgi:CDP-paratose 2-epimerase
LYIDDLVRAFKLAALHIETTAGNVYNMGGGPSNSVSIWEELRPRLEPLAGRSLHVETETWRPGDQPVYISDTRKAGRDFGWQPLVNVDQGLKQLWDWAQALSAKTAQPVARETSRAVLELPKKKRADIALAGPAA